MVAVNETGWQPHYADRSVRGGLTVFAVLTAIFKGLATGEETGDSVNKRSARVPCFI